MNIVRISDGLGNQMFQYAFARKLQILSGKKVYLDTRFINHEDMVKRDGKDSFHQKCGYRKYGLGHFRIVLPEADDQMLLRWKFIEQDTGTERLICYLSQRRLWPWWYRYEDEKEDVAYYLRNSIQSAYFRGYFFDIKYFDDIKPVLQREFQVKKTIRLTPELRKILDRDETVGIHIRKGDFTRLSRDISQTDYYPKAIKKMNGCTTDPVYLIFTDDIDWVKGNLEISGRKIYVSEMSFSDYEELTIMKHCRHNIIANSTFSYWAAYLNSNLDKVVICPRRWKTRIIPKEWICV